MNQTDEIRTSALPSERTVLRTVLYIIMLVSLLMWGSMVFSPRPTPFGVAVMTFFAFLVSLSALAVSARTEG